MKFRMGLAAAIVAGLVGAASAQDGGKIAWKGKEKGDDVKKLMDQAKKDGLGMMLFFTSLG